MMKPLMQGDTKVILRHFVTGKTSAKAKLAKVVYQRPEQIGWFFWFMRVLDRPEHRESNLTVLCPLG
jgi:hypothetical protein